MKGFFSGHVVVVPEAQSPSPDGQTLVLLVAPIGVSPFDDRTEAAGTWLWFSHRSHALSFLSEGRGSAAAFVKDPLVLNDQNQQKQRLTEFCPAIPICATRVDIPTDAPVV